MKFHLLVSTAMESLAKMDLTASSSSTQRAVLMYPPSLLQKKILSICLDATGISQSEKHIAITTFLVELTLTLHQRGLLASNPTL